MEKMKEVFDAMISSNQLLVVVNTLPLYIMSQMFFAGECAMEDEYQRVTQKVFELIADQIMQLKQSTQHV